MAENGQAKRAFKDRLIFAMRYIDRKTSNGGIGCICSREKSVGQFHNNDNFISVYVAS